MDFFRKKRVLVTGCTGFKGSWLSRMLLQQGAEVFGYALPPEDGALFHLLGLGEKMQCEFADIRERENLQAYFTKTQPEIVFHLAAQPIVRRGYREPAETFEINIMGTVNLLEAVRHTGSVRSVINITTDKVYENHEWDWGYRESDTLGASDPYSNSKACSELVTKSYNSSFFCGQTAVSTMRAGNVIGGGDFAQDRIVPDCVRSVIRRTPVLVRNPASVRPYQHVMEALYAYLLLAREQWNVREVAGSYNVGPDPESCVSTAVLVNVFCRLWGEDARWETHAPPSAPHESAVLRLDNSKIRQRLGWRPMVTFAEAMRMTVEWYRAFAQGGNMEDYTEREIDGYFRRREEYDGSGTGSPGDIGFGTPVLAKVSPDAPG